MFARTDTRRRTTAALATAAGAVLALLVAILPIITGCGPEPLTSPEALIRRLAELNSEGRYDEIWDLYHEDARAEFRMQIDQLRTTVERNPDPSNEKLIAQFNVSRAEFYSMTYLELFAREAAPHQRTMDGLEIRDVMEVPDTPGDFVLMWTSFNTLQAQNMRCRRDAEGAFRLIWMAR